MIGIEVGDTVPGAKRREQLRRQPCNPSGRVVVTGREEEFLAEARTLAKFFWKGFDSMLTA